MEIKRILLNRKSIFLFLVLFFVNAGLFYYDVLRDHVPLSDEEIHIVDYSIKNEEIKSQIESFKDIPIFQDTGSSIEEEKTLKDYGKIASVRGEIHRSEGISLWFASSIQNYFILLFIIWLVFLTFDVEKL